MLKLDEAKRILHGAKLGSLQQLLVLLAVEPVEPLNVKTLRLRCAAAGLPRLAKKNLSDILGASRGEVARTPQGWELQQSGIVLVREMAHAANVNLIVTHSSRSLRGHANAISDHITKAFIIEAIACFEANQYRAAVVFSWAGAIALLHRHVFTTKLAELNEEASRRSASQGEKWRSAKQQDDLGRLDEHEFLNVCEAIGVIGRGVRLVLQNECLKLRNACGHPNSLTIAENSVAAHIEKLIHNVFSRF